MFYIITYKGYRLSYFHSNDGTEYKDTIGFSNKNYCFFGSEEEAREQINYIIECCKKEMQERPFTKEVFEKILENVKKFKIQIELR